MPKRLHKSWHHWIWCPERLKKICGVSTCNYIWLPRLDNRCYFGGEIEAQRARGDGNVLYSHVFTESQWKWTDLTNTQTWLWFYIIHTEKTTFVLSYFWIFSWERPCFNTDTFNMVTSGYIHTLSRRDSDLTSSPHLYSVRFMSNTVVLCALRISVCFMDVLIWVFIQMKKLLLNFSLKL